MCNYLTLLLAIIVACFPGLTFAQCIENTQWTKVVPSAKLPGGLNLKNSNNNLDVVKFKDTYYLAFRNAPTHFASKKARLVIVSSPDLENWYYEDEVKLGNDLREPRFTVYNDSLFLYFFEGGHHLLKFEPKRILFTVMDSPGKWTGIQNAYLDGYVPWRIREYKNVLYLSAYYGKDLYKGKGTDLRLFTSTDGRAWKPLSENAQITHPRVVEEGEFLFDKEGNIWGVARLEFDGAYTFYASKDSIDKWKTWYSEYKYDSSLMFEEDGEFFLIARRNLDGDGRFVKYPGKYRKNLVRYSFTKKRTAIFVLDKKNMKWIHLKDFDSTGDTSFPGIVKLADGRYCLFNYSSDLQKRQKSWIIGQFGKTYIYKTILTIKDCL